MSALVRCVFPTSVTAHSFSAACASSAFILLQFTLREEAEIFSILFSILCSSEKQTFKNISLRNGLYNQLSLHFVTSTTAMRNSFVSLLMFLSLALALPTHNALSPFARSSSILDALLAAEDPFRISDPTLLVDHKSVADSILARADWKETPKAHIISLDIPGIRREDVRIEVEEGRVLRVSGERRSEEEAEGEKWHRAERATGKFWRRFRLPWNVDMEGIAAQLETGVLRITVPKLAEHERKREARVVEIVDAGDKGGEDVKASKAEM